MIGSNGSIVDVRS